MDTYTKARVAISNNGCGVGWLDKSIRTNVYKPLLEPTNAEDDDDGEEAPLLLIYSCTQHLHIDRRAVKVVVRVNVDALAIGPLHQAVRACLRRVWLQIENLAFGSSARLN